ncbi:replication-associated protein [Crucivirus-183]|nr:replication-associated protein [Crucivirus-183]
MSRIPREPRFRRFRFTINNPTELNTEMCIAAKGFSYLIVGLEIGSETGTFHFQGYAELPEQRTRSTILKMLGASSEEGHPGWAHILPCNASQHSNVVYASKDCDILVEAGEPSSQGARNDIADVRRTILKGGSMEDVCMQATSYQAMRTGELMMKYLKPPSKPRVEPLVTWLWGPSGTGKTHRATHFFPKPGLPDAPFIWSDGKWWDGYDRHKNVIIDDLRRGMWPFRYLLRLLDKYPFRVEVKGGTREFVATDIVITAPESPEQMFAYEGEELKQLLRRIHIVEYVGAREDLTDPPEDQHDLPSLPCPFGTPGGVASEVKCNSEPCWVAPSRDSVDLTSILETAMGGTPIGLW